jgi:hypothetical protein
MGGGLAHGVMGPGKVGVTGSGLDSKWTDTSGPRVSTPGASNPTT